MLESIHATLCSKREEERRIASQRLAEARARYNEISATKPSSGRNETDSKLAGLQDQFWTERATKASDDVRAAESAQRQINEAHGDENLWRSAVLRLISEHRELADTLRDEELRVKEQSRLDTLMKDAIEHLNRSHDVIHAMGQFGRYRGRLCGRASLLDRCFARLACHGKVLLIPWLEAFEAYVGCEVSINYVRPQEVPEFYVTDQPQQQLHMHAVVHGDTSRERQRQNG